MNLKLLVFFCMFLITSCAINPTDYSMYKQNFLPYPLETITDTTYFSKYREIKAGKLNEIIKKNKTTAVFLSNITCPSPGNKIRISAYEKIVKEMGNVTPVYVFSGFRIPTIHVFIIFRFKVTWNLPFANNHALV